MIIEGTLRDMSLNSGYGFIETKDGDVFVHTTDMPRYSVPIGSVVTAEVKKATKGLAVKQFLRVVSRPELAGDASGSAIRVGDIKWYDRKAGYGWIVDRETGKDVFLHGATVRNWGLWRVNAGLIVWYRAVEISKGPRACWVETNGKTLEKFKAGATG